MQHLDGLYGLYPPWLTQIGEYGANGEWDKAAAVQKKLTHATMLLRQMPVLQSFSAVMNERGIPGHFAPRPFAPLSEEDREKVLDDPIIREVLAATPAAVPA